MSTLEHLTSNNNLAGMYQVKEGIVYSEATGQTLTVIYPWATDYAQEKPVLPLVVFVQGSGWTTPNLGFQLPQLCELARRGYAVASVSHRSIFDGAPVPAQLVDVKCAIRYLRAHAAEYGINPERVAIWRSSSGAQVAQTAGVTAGLERFETGEWADQSDAVSCVVSCFGPCDLDVWVEFNLPNPDCQANIAALLAGTDDERHEAARAVSSLTYVTPERGQHTAVLPERWHRGPPGRALAGHAHVRCPRRRCRGGGRHRGRRFPRVELLEPGRARQD